MVLAAVGQIRSTPNVLQNLCICTELIQKAAKEGAKILFLPEASDFIVESGEKAVQLVQPLAGSFVSGIRNAASTNKIWVSIGVHEAIDDMKKFYNTHLLINQEGNIVSSYRKIHLFDVNIPNGPVLMESKTTVAGDKVVTPTKSPIGNIGLGICYDIRFPELASSLRNRDSQIITYPSAFTVKTGRDHWHILNRCRAIESQCFVISAAQVGIHVGKRESFGHSVIVDPWGKVLVDLEQQENTIGIADIHLSLLEEIRRNMPILEHRRRDIFESN